MTITAWEVWDREIRAGIRPAGECDPLAIAACYEANAAECEALARTATSAYGRAVWMAAADDERRKAAHRLAAWLDAAA
jgi:hypothetical protein